MTLSTSEADYLKAIYALTRSEPRATTNQLAERLAVRPASVTSMIQKLARAQPPLVEYEKRQGVALTAAGRTAAVEMIRHHRLLETFLHDVLGFAWDEVHEEAERMEHVISERFEERIAQMLNNPQRDPHGSPIPNRALKMPAFPRQPLSQCQPGQRVTIVQVPDEDAALLRTFRKEGLVPQATLTILALLPDEGILRVQVADHPEPLTLLMQLARHIWVAAKVDKRAMDDSP